MGTKGTRQRYTPEFKQDAVKLVIENAYNCRDAARRLKIDGFLKNRKAVFCVIPAKAGI